MGIGAVLALGSGFVALALPLATAACSTTAPSLDPPGCHPYATPVDWQADRTTDIIYPLGNEDVGRHQTVNLTVGQTWLLQVRGGCRAAGDPVVASGASVLTELRRTSGSADSVDPSYHELVAVLYRAVTAGDATIALKDVCYVPAGSGGACTSNLSGVRIDVSVAGAATSTT